jgi:hypothetical protein
LHFQTDFGTNNKIFIHLKISVSKIITEEKTKIKIVVNVNYGLGIHIFITHTTYLEYPILAPVFTYHSNRLPWILKD